MKLQHMALGLTLLTSVALAQPAAAPAGAPQGDGKGSPIARMQNELGLTDEQVKKMREIRDQGGSRAQMQAVLTPEQRAKVVAQHKEHGGNREERKSRMQTELGLSNEQMAKMEEIRKAGGSRQEIRAVLTPQQQAKFDALRSQLKGSGQPHQE
jgi:Spy/CpxP family protein refolding chaperone